MNVTIRNYAAKAVAGLGETARRLGSNKFSNDEIVITDFLPKLEGAVHFALPDGALLLNDTWRGLKGVSLKLPYPTITIEYAEPQINSEILIFAEETKLSDIDITPHTEYADITSSNDDAIAIYKFYTDQGFWGATPFAATIMSDWLDEKGRMRISTFSYLPDFEQWLISDQGRQEATRIMITDAVSAVAVVCELIEALTCSNVKDTIVQNYNPALNQRRARKGKLPLYETRILTIDSGKPKSQARSNGPGSHASPRMHLRRGHIRRYPDKNIWVNSCVVGNREQGVIEKSYSVL